jgi:hypothetical protein
MHKDQACFNSILQNEPNVRREDRQGAQGGYGRALLSA